MTLDNITKSLLSNFKTLNDPAIYLVTWKFTLELIVRKCFAEYQWPHWMNCSAKPPRGHGFGVRPLGFTIYIQTIGSPSFNATSKSLCLDFAMVKET